MMIKDNDYDSGSDDDNDSGSDGEDSDYDEYSSNEWCYDDDNIKMTITIMKIAFGRKIHQHRHYHYVRI